MMVMLVQWLQAGGVHDFGVAVIGKHAAAVAATGQHRGGQTNRAVAVATPGQCAVSVALFVIDAQPKLEGERRL